MIVLRLFSPTGGKVVIEVWAKLSGSKYNEDCGS